MKTKQQWKSGNRLDSVMNVLLIALTGYGQKEDQQRAMEAGFDRHFVKPTDPQRLVELIAQWPAQPSPEVALRALGPAAR